jgi:VWFA-related protein
MPGTVQNPSTEDARYGSGNLDLAGLVKNIDARIVERPLEVSAAATGGAYVATVKDRSIENAIDEIGGELHSQYSISYTPMGTSGSGYHEINVRVNAKGLKVRARPGYYIASDNR